MSCQPAEKHIILKNRLYFQVVFGRELHVCIQYWIALQILAHFQQSSKKERIILKRVSPHYAYTVKTNIVTILYC